MKRKWMITTIIAFVIIVAAICILVLLPSYDTVNRGPVWEAIERTLGPYNESNPVKEDLIARGLVSLEAGKGGYIKVGEIEELVKEQIYVIDEQGYLQFGPSYSPPNTQ